MSYLVDKLDLKKNRLYRKVKLDIDEVMDSGEAIEEIGVNMDIYGDNEGYFFVKKKEDDKYLVKFLNLDLLVSNKIITIDISPKDKIDMFSINDIQKIDMISTEELDFDEMDENYVRLDLKDIVRELIEQANSKGKKGIKLDKEYLDKYSKKEKIKETGESKKTPLTLNDNFSIPIDFIGDYETPLPDNIFNRIKDMEKLKKNLEVWFRLPFTTRVIPSYEFINGVAGMITALFGENEPYVPSYRDFSGTQFEFLKKLKENPEVQQVYYLDIFGNPNNYEILEKTEIPPNNQIFLQLFRIYIKNRGYTKDTTYEKFVPNTRLFYDPVGIISDFYDRIKNTNRYKSIEKKLFKYFDSNIKFLEDYENSSDLNNFIDYDYETRNRIIQVINDMIESNISQDEFAAFVFNFKNRPRLPSSPKPEEEYKPNPDKDAEPFIFITEAQQKKVRYPKSILKSLREGIDGYKSKDRLTPFFEISDKVMKEQMDKKYSPSNGKKYLEDNNLTLEK